MSYSHKYRRRGADPGVVAVPVVMEEGEITMTHFSNEPNVPSKCLLVTQM